MSVGARPSFTRDSIPPAQLKCLRYFVGRAQTQGQRYHETQRHRKYGRHRRWQDETTIKTSFDVEKDLTDLTEEIDRVNIVQRAVVDPENTEDMPPVTARHLYMLARLQACGGALFVRTFDYLILHPVEADRLEGAWKVLLKKHSVLRTTFAVLGNGDPRTVQIVLKDADNSIK
jgi:hypothetical protein